MDTRRAISLLKRVADWLGNEKKRSGVFFRTEGTKFAYIVVRKASIPSESFMGCLTA